MRCKNICIELIFFVCFSFFVNGQQQLNLQTDTRFNFLSPQYKIKRNDMTIEKAEKLADQIARDFEIRKYIRNKIIYEDYSPVTNQQRYCEESRTAKDILQRAKNPDGVVYALAEYNKNGYFIVFGQYVLNNPSMMIETVVHEMAHLYCVAKGLNQGEDEHSEDYKVWYGKIYDYVFENLEKF